MTYDEWRSTEPRDDEPLSSPCPLCGAREACDCDEPFTCPEAGDTGECFPDAPCDVCRAVAAEDAWSDEAADEARGVS